MSDTERPRRFYGRRSGHKLNQGRQQLVDELLPSLRVPSFENQTNLDPATFFEGAVDDVWLEIGFGGGEHLAAQALSNPAVGLIGCEPFINGVASLLGHIDKGGQKNIRLHDDDARPLIESFADKSLGKVFILFPDPWPKKKHHRRRFISPENLDTLARVIRPGGRLRFGSDHDGYVKWALRYLTADRRFQWTAKRPEDWKTRPADWPETRYEAKAKSKGISSTYLEFQRK